MMPELFERDLPLNVITRNSERKRRLKLAVIIFAALVLLFVFVNYSFPSLQNIYGSKNFDYVKPLKSNRINNLITKPQTTVLNESKIWLDYCNLTDINPWDSTIIKFIKPEKDHMLNCKSKIFQHSKFVDGQLFIYSNETFSLMEMNCTMRCLFPKSDHSLLAGIWKIVINGTKPKCDVIEIECRSTEDRDEEEVEPFYKYLHAQIYRDFAKLPLQSISKQQPEKYDVNIIVLDSISQTQFIRSMPKTLYMLERYYDTIPFHRLNKIGVNSFYNGFALLIGKMVNDIPKSPFSRGYAGDYSTCEKACEAPLNDEQFIGFEFQDNEYITMMAEDWASGVFNWPNCKGFNKTPMHHYMRPFQLRIEKVGDKPKDMAKTILQDSCREYHHDNMDYLKNFLKAYPDKPKFSITWMSSLTHDFENALSSSDDFFSNFFNDTRKEFENSFLFVMGDHGLRFQEIRETKVGEMEDNNPALFISVPKSLRNDANLMKQLRANSKELITHYDIYATLHEIAQAKNSSTILHGSSLLHPLPYPRTCDSLQIPFEFCNCHVIKPVLSKNNTIGIPAVKLMVEQMNFNLSNSHQTLKICSELALNESADVIVEDYGSEQNVQIYKITFTTLPGNGKFWGFITYNSANQVFQILSSFFPRLNSYNEQAKCVDSSSPVISYCYCINQTDSNRKN